MQFFRRLVHNRIGKAIALGFLLLIGLAFAAGDITGTGGLDVLGTNAPDVAKIGGQRITANELQSRTQRFFERFRDDQPELTMSEFLAKGGLTQVTEELIASKALIAYGEQHGMRVSKKLVDAEIARTPAFADATGIFSENQFRSILAQQRISEKELREDFAGQIIRQHLLMAAGAGSRTPESFVAPYAAMLIEQREGEMYAIPSQAFAPKETPTEAQLKAYYTSHPDTFTVPEQRKLRYVVLTRDRFTSEAAPSEDEIAAAYKARAKDYAAREVRDFSQLIVPTEAQAKEIAAKAAGGKPLVDLANDIGLSATRLNDQDQAALAGATSADMAKAAFAASKGALIGPFKAPLGWALLRVEDVRTIAGKTLEQAKPELVTELRDRKSKELFADFVNDIDGKLGDGATLSEVAKANDLEVVETPLLTAEGRNLRDSSYKPDGAVTALIKPAFTMSSNDDPQIVQIALDEAAAILAPGEIVAAGPPPFDEIKNAVQTAWTLSEGATKARAAADKIVAALGKGVAIDEALKQAGAADLPRQPLSVRRVDLRQQQGRVPPPLEALFLLTPGKSKVVPMEQNLGFIVVRLDKVTEEDPTANQQLMGSTRAGLANVLGSEYGTQLTAAIEKELKVSRNQKAIAAVEKALREANGTGQ